MAQGTRHRRSAVGIQARRGVLRRRRLIGAAVAVLALAVGAAVASSLGAPRDRPVPPRIDVLVGRQRLLSLATTDVTPARVRALAERLPTTVDLRRGRARLQLRLDRAATAARILRARSRGGPVEAGARAVAAGVPAPAIQQAQRNTCESAAVEILLATVGRRVAQERVQAAFPRAEPLDPRDPGTSSMVWGDPDQGYVGRPDGGGPAGGFGIYPGPVRSTVARLGVRLVDLSGGRPADVYAALREGRAVMAWVGLSDGPYGAWRTPQGRRVEVNFGEHTVVLHGIEADGTLAVANPLEATEERWAPRDFELMWARLGNRALATGLP